MKKYFLTVLVSAIFISGAIAQKSSKIPLIGSKAPSFKAESTDGKIKFPDDFGSHWKILFSHPHYCLVKRD